MHVKSSRETLSVNAAFAKLSRSGTFNILPCSKPDIIPKSHVFLSL